MIAAADVEKLLRRWAKLKIHGCAICSGSEMFAVTHLAELTSGMIEMWRIEKRLANQEPLSQCKISDLGTRIRHHMKRMICRSGKTSLADSKIEADDLREIELSLEEERTCN